MAFTERQLEGLLSSGANLSQVAELVESYHMQRENLAKLNNRVELLQEMIQDLAIRNSELDLQRRVAQSQLSKLEAEHKEVVGRMTGLEK